MRTLNLLAVALLLTVSTVACERKGPMERAGERADEAVDNVAEGRNPLATKGPAEKAGEAIDDAADSVTDKH